MIYFKKVEVGSEVTRLMIKIHRAPQTYTNTFLDEINDTDHPVMQALSMYGFIEPVVQDEDCVTMGLTGEGWEFWRQVIAVARRDPRGKERFPSEAQPRGMSIPGRV